MKKNCLILCGKEFLSYAKVTFLMIFKGLARIPCMLFLGMVSLLYWIYKKLDKFCRENTKVAVIIGFILCFLLMFVEFVYFKLKLQESSNQISLLIRKNYQLEQTDRYEIGYYDAMTKNRKMLREGKQ